MNIKEKVAKGVRWLDENHSGWKKQIDVSRLDMTEYENCILGQMFDDYDNAEKVLGEKFCEDFGFIDREDWREAKELTKEWLQVLEENFDLSVDKVKPGFYKVVNIIKTSFSINEILLVVDPHSNLDIRSDYGNIINCVVDIHYRMFVNCPVIVKKSEIGF